MTWLPTDEFPHPHAAVDEWVLAAWRPDGSAGVVSGHRLLGRRAWYWSALVDRGWPLLHLTEWDVVVRADPFVVKAPEMWAEHHCVAPMEQWSIGNEAHAAALDDPDAALDRAYGVPSPMAVDLEWYATGPPAAIEHGYQQAGVVHGVVELLDRPGFELVEAPARRWRRWHDEPDLAPLDLPRLTADPAHTDLRAPFAFPDGSVADWVLTPAGWRSRRR